jgi:hypothetical protein
VVYSQVSAKNKGFARKIYEASDAAHQVSGLYREISSVVIQNLTITYHPTSSNHAGRDVIPIETGIVLDNVTALTRPTGE